MTDFARSFCTETLKQCKDVPVIRALFDRWVLPGQDAGAEGLRVAIRDGYLNFYIKGQSVAKLTMRKKTHLIEVHEKYVAGVPKGHEDEGKYSQKYKRITFKRDEPGEEQDVGKWVRTAETYAGDEKRFVDDLVAVTPGTLDLEMALPTFLGAATSSSSPRMDLIVAQGTELAFWEAKCAVNGELRSDPKRGIPPHVIDQLLKYVNWVGRPVGHEQVKGGYLATAKILLELAELFGRAGAAIDAWRAFLDAGDQVSALLPPGVVVGNYCPLRADGKARDGDADKFKAAVVSFSRNEHDRRLERFGVTVEPIDAKPSTACLRTLCAGSIAATEPGR